MSNRKPFNDGPKKFIEDAGHWQEITRRNQLQWQVRTGLADYLPILEFIGFDFFKILKMTDAQIAIWEREKNPRAIGLREIVKDILEAEAAA